jgi:hypothetical protein
MILFQDFEIKVFLVIVLTKLSIHTKIINQKIKAIAILSLKIIHRIGRINVI